MLSNAQILGVTFILGILPSLFWLWFWLREDRKNPEPKGVLAAVFLTGILSVIVVLPIQKIIQTQVSVAYLQPILWVTAEEVIKYLAVLVILFKTNHIDEPVDWPIYLITAALGFAALENMLFLIKPFMVGQNTVALLTGQLRFLGSTLLHTVSSGALGIALGMSLFMDRLHKFIYLIFGVITAVTLHSTFNFFIIRNGGEDFLKVFGFLWVATIIVMLLFEKLRRMV